jgi:hypothetical protein
MLAPCTLLIAAILAQDGSASPDTPTVGIGADDMVSPERVPLHDDGARGKGLRPEDELFSTRVQRQNGSKRLAGNLLRSLVQDAGSPNKVLPSPYDFITPNPNAILSMPFLTAPLDGAVKAIRALSDDLGVTFEPGAAMTWQHATKVVDGAPHGKGLVWYGAAGRLRLWHDTDGIGEVVYNLQGNAGVGSPFKPIMGQAVGNPLANNNIIISANFGLYMLYWQQAMLDGRLRMRVGKMEFQAFFDRNAIAYDPIGGFLAQNFNQSSAIPFPDYGFGGVAGWDFTKDLTLRGGVQNSSSIGITPGFDGMSSSNLFALAELDYRVWIPIGTEYQREGHRRFIVWHSGIDDWRIGSGHIDGWGMEFNMDQAITDQIVVFCRVGWGQDDVSPMSVSISAGFAVEDVLPFTDMGFAVEWGKVTSFGRTISDVNAARGEQLLLEWYANIHVSPSLHMGPVIQAVRDRAAGIDTSLIYGFRSSWAF